MAGYTECVKETVKACVPPDIGWWLLALLIACLVTALVGGVATGGAALPLIITGCAATIGICIAGPIVLGIVAGLLRCLPTI